MIGLIAAAEVLFGLMVANEYHKDEERKHRDKERKDSGYSKEHRIK